MRGRRHHFDDDFAAKALEWRGVDTPCERCGGSGVFSYASTALWRGGMGGASISNGVCDHCWGSGDANNPWTDLRALRDTENERIAKAAGKLLERSIGAEFETIKPAIEHLCALLDKQARRRKPPTGEDFRGQRNWEIVCSGLSNALRKMCVHDAR